MGLHSSLASCGWISQLKPAWSRVCACVSVCTCLHLPGVPPDEVISLLSYSCLLLHRWQTQHKRLWNRSTDRSKWKHVKQTICKYVSLSPEWSPNQLFIEAQSLTLTCGGLQLLVFLFPPFPGLEDASQAGQLAVAADGRRTNPWDQATRMQHPLLVHHVYGTKQTQHP